MAFSWRRIKRGLRSGKPPRDRREDRETTGHFADAPEAPPPARAFHLCPHSWNTLHGAAALGHTRILQRLLQNGWAVNERDSQGRSPLFFAVDSGQRFAAERLLAWGADPNLRDDAGRSSMHVAVARHSHASLQRLLDAGGSANCGVGDGPTPLMEAARAGDTPMLRSLLAAGAEPDARDRYGHTALFFVGGAVAAHVLPDLLAAGAEREARSFDHDTARHRALRAGDPVLYRALTPVDDEALLLADRGHRGDPPLLCAAESGSVPLVERLLRAGAPIDIPNDLGHTALLIALTREHLPVATTLMRAGAPVGFLEAVALGDAARAAALPLPSRADIDAPICGQETPLMGAVARGREDLVRLLLGRGARCEIATSTLGTALDVAFLTGELRIARLLILHGAEPGACRKFPLREIVRRLREADHDDEVLPQRMGSLTDRPDVEEIYTAACAPDDDALRFLLLRGADPEARDSSGETALMRAARQADLPAVRRLLALGVDPSGVDSRTPEIARMLSDARAPRPEPPER